MALPIKSLKTCSHRVLVYEGAKNSGFFRLHLILRSFGAKEPKIMASPVFTLSYVVLCESTFYERGCFVKRFTKMASAPPIELFMELKPQKIASLVKWSRFKRRLKFKTLSEDHPCDAKSFLALDSSNL